MQNLQTNEALLQHFQVEELEERLENKWVADCETVCYTNGDCQTVTVTKCR